MSERIEYILHKINGLQEELSSEKEDLYAKFRYNVDKWKLFLNGMPPHTTSGCGRIFGNFSEVSPCLF